MTEDEVVGWHHRLNGHQFEQALGDGEGQGSLACCSPWGRKELDMPEGLSTAHTRTHTHIMYVLCIMLSCSVVSDPLRPLGLQSTRLLGSWGLSRQEYWSGFLPFSRGSSQPRD